MEEPEIPDDVSSGPPATHWNVSRDPRWSFACPYCKDPIELTCVQLGQMSLPNFTEDDVIGMCRPCRKMLFKDEWEYFKAMELLQR